LIDKGLEALDFFHAEDVQSQASRQMVMSASDPNAVGRTIYGTCGNDVINGGEGGDTIYGGAGNDTINGAEGNDTIYGGKGTDTINGGEGTDTVIGGDPVGSPQDVIIVNGGEGPDNVNYDGDNGPDLCEQPVVTIDGTVVDEDAGYANFLVRLNRVYDQDVSVTWQSYNGSASSPGDFTSSGSTLVIPAGHTSGTVTVPINNDTDNESDESFEVHLTGVTNAELGDSTATCTIIDNDTPSGSKPLVSISSAGLVSEGDGAAIFTISLNQAINKTVHVHYTTVDVTALAGVHYTAASGDVYFAPNETSKQIAVGIIDDLMYEGNVAAPYFNVTLSNPVNALIGTASGYAQIIDDDDVPTLSIPDITATEGDPGGATVYMTVLGTLSNPANFPVNFTLVITSGTAVNGSDYTLVSTTFNLIIPSGATNVGVSFPVINDLIPEPTEYFYATITTATVVLTDYQATCQIVDNDRTVTVDIDTDSNNSGQITDADDPIEMDNPARMIVLRDSDNANTPVAQKDLALVRFSVATAGFTQAELNNSTLVLTFDSGGDRIRIWQDPLGNTPLLMNHLWAYTAFPGTVDVWVEGLQIGSAVLAWTMNVNGLAVGQDLIRLNVVQGNLEGHRSRMGSGREGTQYHAIAYATETLALTIDQEEALGVGLRRNFDDDNADGTIDTWQATVAFEDDTAELTSTSEIPQGAELVLRASNDNIAIWDGSEKTNILVGLDPVTGVMHNEYVVPLPFFNHSYFVEWVNNTPGAGAASAELYVRDPRSGGTRFLDRVNYYPYNSVVVVLSGEDLSGSGPATGSGLFPLAEALYLEGYNAYFFDEDEVSNTGSGLAYDLVRHQLRDHVVGEVSIFGHSHGGGSTHDLAGYLSQNQSTLPSFSVPFTAYVDAIKNTSDVETAAEDRRPPLSQFHSNFWQWYYYPSPLALHGASIPGSEDDINVNSQWGTSDAHTTMDNNIQIVGAIRGRVESKVSR